MSRPNPHVLLSVVGLGLAAALTACGGQEDSSGTAPTPQEPVVVEISFSDGTVDPMGERVQVGVGQEIILAVTADEAGELHAHTTEELTLDYPAGESELTMTVDQPGVVDVESHDLDQVVVQLQAS